MALSRWRGGNLGVVAVLLGSGVLLVFRHPVVTVLRAVLEFVSGVDILARLAGLIPSDVRAIWVWEWLTGPTGNTALMLVGLVLMLLAIGVFCGSGRPDMGERETKNRLNQSPPATLPVSPRLPQGPMMLPHPFIRPALLALTQEINRLSTKQFREECLLDPDECLGVEERISIAELTMRAAGYTLSIVPQMNELLKALSGVAQHMLYGNRVEPGYDTVAERYGHLMQQRWVRAAKVHKDGVSPTSRLTRYVYGMIEVDRAQLDDMIRTLDNAESVIRTMPLPRRSS